MQASVTQRRVNLPVMNGQCELVSKATLDEMREEYRVVDYGYTLSDDMAARIRARGEVMDCGRVLIQIVSRAINPTAGMNYSEIEQIRPIVAKLTAAPAGGHVLLEEHEFLLVGEKVKQPFLSAYSLVFDTFIQSVLSSGTAKLVEEVPDQEAEAG